MKYLRVGNVAGSISCLSESAIFPSFMTLLGLVKRMLGCLESMAVFKSGEKCVRRNVDVIPKLILTYHVDERSILTPVLCNVLAL